MADERAGSRFHCGWASGWPAHYCTAVRRLARLVLALRRVRPQGIAIAEPALCPCSGADALALCGCRLLQGVHGFADDVHHLLAEPAAFLAVVGAVWGHPDGPAAGVRAMNTAIAGA